MSENQVFQNSNFITGRKPGRPRKEDVHSNFIRANEFIQNASNVVANSENQFIQSHVPTVTRKRGRPKKDNTSPNLISVTPSQLTCVPMQAAMNIGSTLRSRRSDVAPFNDISNLTATSPSVHLPNTLSSVGSHANQKVPSYMQQAVTSPSVNLAHMKSVVTPQTNRSMTDITNLTDAGRRRSVMSNWKPNNFPSRSSLELPPDTNEITPNRVPNTNSSQCSNQYTKGISVFVPEVSSLNIPIPAWYSDQQTLDKSGNKKRLLSKTNNIASTSGKNLFESFNIDGDMNINEDASELHHEEYTSDGQTEADILGHDLWAEYMDLGKPDKICPNCKAQMWNEERNNKSVKYHNPTFSICCKNGQVKLPEERQPPPFLASLLSGGEKTSHFKQFIRTYNSMFAFTSIGGKIDHKINDGRGPYCFKLCGQNHHFIGQLFPEEGEAPKYAQLYIYDTENETDNRVNALPGNDSIDRDIVEGLLRMLDDNNKLVQGFRMARDRFNLDYPEEFSLVLLSSKAASGRLNHVSQSNEVAAIIVGDVEESEGFKDIVVQTKQKFFKRIEETFVSYMQLQYPLLFPYGDDGFHLDIPLHGKTHVQQDENADETGERKRRTTVSLREYYAYKLMIRPSEGLTMHLGGRLWQQYIVDAFAAIEQYRLNWIRMNQKTIRFDLYRSIRDSIRKGDNNPAQIGKNVILPASFTGSQRYMSQYYQDSLAICRTIGHPSLFLTMTCNTKWPEIERMLEHLPGVDVADAPDIVSRVFKLKLDQLLDLIKNKNYFGRCMGVMHVIEFQKRGLPHTHMLVWLHPEDRPKRIEHIDELVSAEIPDKEIDPVGYEVVKNFMIHGPCGKDCTNSPCMVKDKCIRHFPKRLNLYLIL